MEEQDAPARVRQHDPDRMPLKVEPEPAGGSHAGKGSRRRPLAVTGEQARRLPPDGHDQRTKYAIESELGCPQGLGVVEEFIFLRERASHPVKVAIPGPHTLAGRLVADGEIYKNRDEIAWALSGIVRREMERLVEAGADFIQIDEPSIACYKENVQAFVEILNQTIQGIHAKLAMHLCFGNYRARPIGLRRRNDSRSPRRASR